MSWFTEKIQSLFLLPEDDDHSELSISFRDEKNGKRQTGTKVRMSDHSFTTVTGQPAELSAADAQPLDDEARALLELAKAVRQNAYAKYSGFQVGAALKASSGQVYFGVNVENASYPAGICAERAAFAAAVAAGERKFSAIAICGGDDTVSCFPCGICRQVLLELCPPDMPVILENGVYRLNALLPYAFHLVNR